MDAPQNPINVAYVNWAVANIQQQLKQTSNDPNLIISSGWDWVQETIKPDTPLTIIESTIKELQNNAKGS